MEIIEKLRQFVEKGGTLIFTGNTAAFNEWRERRRTNPLLGLLREDARLRETIAKGYGEGKLVYIPEVQPGSERIGVSVASGRPFPSRDWLLPVNHQQIADTIAANLSRGLSVQTEAPLTTVMELLTRRDSKETLLHFVNFDLHRRLEPFGIRLQKQFSGEVRSVKLLHPEEDEPVEIDFRAEGDSISCTLPGMQLYSMIVVGQ